MPRVIILVQLALSMAATRYFRWFNGRRVDGASPIARFACDADNVGVDEGSDKALLIHLNQIEKSDFGLR